MTVQKSMKLKSLVSLALLFSFVLSLVPTALAIDEGMFTPSQIAELNLKKRGLKIDPKDIWNPGNGGLTDAIIRLNAGQGSCTAEFVSPDGLILTNHHCGFDALVSASTPDKDLVETGFNAGGRTGEFQAKNYAVFITTRVEDVTAKVRGGTESLSGDALSAALDKNTKDLATAEQAKAPSEASVRVQPIDSGYFYYLYQVQPIKDIRMVFAPPRNIGVFGGDPDNFEWTRHTGDFTFLRAYVAPDGTPADYSPNNVPYHPKRFMTLNIGGIKDGDFTFVMGYPGGTTRYRESWSIDYAKEANFPFLFRWFRGLADTLTAEGATDEDKRIKFQSDIADYNNERKLYEGGYLRLIRANVVENRRAEEAKMAAWIAADPKRQQHYGTMLSDLKTLSETSNAAQKRDAIIRRFPDPISGSVYGSMVAAAAAAKAGRPLNDQQKAAITQALTERDPFFEREMLKFFLREFDALPAGQRFDAYDKKFAGTTGKARRDAEAAYAASITDGDFTKPENVFALASMPWSEIQAKHPLLAGVIDERFALAQRGAAFNAKIDNLRRLYMDALTTMEGKTTYPDANLTLRFTYGNVKGYQSREAEFRSPFTTLKGMIEKNTGEKPFDVPAKLIDLQNAKDFGRYGENGSVVLDFLSTTDIIGGNSGSPIMNGNGEQVGIVFDGNFEGLGNDFYYDYDTNRTISCDVRFILFVTEKFGGAKWVTDEIKTVGGKS
ncbi:MAG: S46 family peptidase [Pyrinomonadaceae bacterium]